LVIFGMGLSIPEDQQQTCLELSQPSWLQNALANDWLSWDREYETATDNKQDFIKNAIWVLMNKHSITCDEAKAVCRDKAKQYAEEYAQIVRAAQARDDLCRDAKVYLDAQQFVTSGNIVWGLQSPRYNADIGLSPKQLEMAKAIWSDDTIGWNQGVGRRKEASAAAEDPDIETSGVVASGAVHQAMAAAREVPELSTEVRRSHCQPRALTRC
jgi:fusicocca-2,10(14)-diene synthase/ophiobolin F synthase